MLDGLGRNITYMRVSVTDRCNLRCRYCMPEDLPMIAHERILRYEEILRVCAAAARLGIGTVKVTGGEPLVRRGCIGFLRELKAVPGIKNVTLTTNGVLLEKYADDLADLRIDGVNISLDTLNAGTYRELTGSDSFGAVHASLYAAVRAGLRVKVNCVPLRDINEGELISIARIAEELPVDVRFIELMPTGVSREQDRITGDEVLLKLRQAYPGLRPDERAHGFGPARYYRGDGLVGSVGFIDALSHYFCARCNRVRLTSDGFFRLCLHREAGFDVRALLRGGASDREIQGAMEEAIRHKPRQHGFDDIHAGGIGSMSKIGG